MELDDNPGYGAEITGVKQSTKGQLFQISGVAHEIPNQDWQGKKGNLGVINAVEEEKICNLGEVSREFECGNSLLATDMATKTFPDHIQGIPKRMWLPQSTIPDFGGELREIGGGGLGFSKEISGESLILHKREPKIPQFPESAEKPISQNPLLCKPRIPTEDQSSQSTESRCSRKDEIKKGNSKDSRSNERLPGAMPTQTRLEVIPQSLPSNPSTKRADSTKDLSSWELLKQKANSGKIGNDEADVNPVQSRTEIEGREGILDPLFDEGGSPVFGNNARLEVVPQVSPSNLSTKSADSNKDRSL
ncbi:hypothetical protein U1Q18_009120 [Sarracenia purpurea var. burkii]